MPSLRSALNQRVYAALEGPMRSRVVDRPIILVGTGRSGSTALRRALGTHPFVLAAPDEAPLLRELGAFASLYRQRARDTESGAYFLEYARYSPGEFRAQVRMMALTASFGERGVARAALHKGAEQGLATLRSLQAWCVRTFPDQQQFEALQWVFPEARFVHLLRNGIDCVNSMMHFPDMKARLTFERMCERWAAAVDRYAYVHENANAIHLDHADMLADPEAFCARLQSFLKLPYSAKPASFLQSTMTIPLGGTTKQNVSAEEEHAKRPPAYEGWTDDQRMMFSDICGKAMVDSGYELPF